MNWPAVYSQVTTAVGSRHVVYGINSELVWIVCRAVLQDDHGPAQPGQACL
jgi:hypothetical protein